MEYQARYGARTPLMENYPEKIGAYLNAVLPTYGLQFADWWRDRLVPEMQRNFDYLEGRLDAAEQMTLMELACLFEDAIDIHDRHWKIHWMLNFAQLSATLNLRAVMEKTHGRIDEALLGRLQNSAKDRNWDSIEALWKMKEEAKGDSELAEAFKHETAGDILEALRASDRGRRFISDRVEPYQKEFGWHAVWSHEFVFPTVREQIQPLRSRTTSMPRRRRSSRVWMGRRSRRCGRQTTSTCAWRRSPLTTTSTSTRGPTRTCAWC
jgi:pyruvate,water dikinase